jgi:hypothetical protein
MPTFDDIITKAEADLSAARLKLADVLNAAEREAAPLRYEIRVNERVLDALRTALAETTAPTPGAAQAFADEALAPVPEPAKEEEEDQILPQPAPAPGVASTHPLRSAVGANGFDRMAAKRQFRLWHVSYPLARSYRIPSQMMRQALRAVVLDLPNYRDDWLTKGGTNLGDSTERVSVNELREIAQLLGVDTKEVENAAYRLWREVKTFGTQGVDYLWGADE